jgi:hypothetical protein
MIVPTKVWEKNGYKLALMFFPDFGKEDEEEIAYEFHLVEIDSEINPLKIKKYKPPLDLKEIAREFEAKQEDVEELLEKIGYR